MGRFIKKFKYVRRILSGVRLQRLNECLNKSRERSGKNKAWLFLDMLWCSLRYGAGYHDYLMFAFYDMDSKHRGTYVTRIKNKKLISLVNDPAAGRIFDHKTLLYKRFREYLGREFLVVSEMTEESFNAFMRGKDCIFAKPDVGESGKGIVCLKRADFANLHSMYVYIKGDSFGVIEDELVQHPAFSALHPSSINTLRIVTLVTEQKEALCVYAVIKAGTGDRFVDNLESGGLFCPVDRFTGEITGVGHTSALSTLSRHPDTGIELTGYKLPYVRESVELCKKAALEVSGMGLVGWDVCVTVNGPVIVEGNDYPGYDFWQQPEHTPDRIGLWPFYKRYVSGL